MVEEAII
jgi:hypothetical protein